MMVKQGPSSIKRKDVMVTLKADLVVIGGGMAGICTAITAAREGLKVVLVQDRPVLGGNGSSEVRLWVLGATSHLGNNNRWSREGGVIDEILVENLYRNKEGNPVIFDIILLEKVKNETNIKLLLNTSVYDVKKHDEKTIASITAFCSQNSTKYHLTAPLFCDASGDGIVGYKAGASFRMGAESKNEFNEGFSPSEEYGELLGHTIIFYSKDSGKPVSFIPPTFAVTDIEKIPRYRNIKSTDNGCNFWWLEYGGRNDTIHETEEIKWELWSIVYGVWNYIKNSGKHPEAVNQTLEWVGTIPGKRESRRFEGWYMLKQQDIVEQKHFSDTVSYGGWAIDLHPADGVFSELPGCTQYHSKGIYEIPYRCFISKDIKNLFLAGRLISASHVAFGSTRVMATSGHGGQAVGMAAVLCRELNVWPADLMDTEKMVSLQQRLNIAGQSIPGIPIDNRRNLSSKAEILASSELILDHLPFDGDWFKLEISAGQLLPLRKAVSYSFEVTLDVFCTTVLEVELRISSKKFNYTPDEIIGQKSYALRKGIQKLKIDFEKTLQDDQYSFLLFRRNPNVKIGLSDRRITGIVSVFNKTNPAVNNFGIQIAPDDSGFDSFEFWCPERRPKGKNIALTISPPLDFFSSQNIINGFTRPYIKPNAWIADIDDKAPYLIFVWDQKQTIHNLTFYFDTDFDHPMESSQMGHPENVIPFCVRNFKIFNSDNNLLFEKRDNYQTINFISLSKPVNTRQIRIEFEYSSSEIPISLFEVRIN
jgi:hypothetical protein